MVSVGGKYISISRKQVAKRPTPSSVQVNMKTSILMPRTTKKNSPACRKKSLRPAGARSNNGAIYDYKYECHYRHATKKGSPFIEVMIVVAIIGILSAIAAPSYTEYIARGHRADARAGSAAAGGWSAAASYRVYPTTLPDTFTGWNPDATKRYTIGFRTGNTNAAFTLTATPKKWPKRMTSARHLHFVQYRVRGAAGKLSSDTGYNPQTAGTSSPVALALRAP